MGNAAIGWPVLLTKKGSQNLVQLPAEVTASQVTWLMITDVHSYEAQTVEWISPWSASLRFTKAQLSDCKGAVLGLRATRPAPLLQVAASQAFWDLKQEFLGRLASHLGVAVEGPSLVDKL
eukprot:205404-Lingulodinium_polyedra.AAC.1